MEEIRINEYVRTNEGIIDKVKDFSNDTSFYHCENGMIIDVYSKCATYLKDIINHSFNIIDLVQYGDYGIMSYRGMIIKKIIGKDDLVELQLKNYKLLKIATKEQMEDILYEVGE